MHLTKAGPDGNLHWFYRMEIEHSLFRDYGLVRNWGRIGSLGQMWTDWFRTEAEAKDVCFDLHTANAKRGFGWCAIFRT